MCHLRTKYKLNLKAYLRSFKPSDDDLMRDVEDNFGMFVRWEARLMRRSRETGLGRVGKAAVGRFGEAVAGDGVLTEDSDFVFVAIDFEGQHGVKTGIKEFGVAVLDTRSCLRSLGRKSASGETAITCLSYARTHSASRHFQYGTTTKMDADLVSELITSHLAIQDDEDIQATRLRKVVLVGQSIKQELYNIEQLGLDVRQLGVVGIIDTFDLGQSTFGKSLRLRDIMDRLEMPQGEHSYHTAGKDACFALQAMLAMLVRRHRMDASYPERLDWLDQVARSVEARPQYMDKEPEEDWEDCLGGNCFNAFAAD